MEAGWRIENVDFAAEQVRLTKS